MNATAILPYFPLIFAAVIVTVAVIGERSLLGDERNMFTYALANASPDAQARIVAAIERRRKSEHFAMLPLIGGIAALLAIGVASALRLLNPNIALATCMMIYAVTGFAQIATARRNDPGRRAAALKERGILDLVPLWVICIPLSSTAATVAVMSAFGFSIPMLLAAITPLVGMVALPIIVRTPAIVGTEDANTDEVLDEKVRGSRLRQMLLITSYAPLLTLFAIPSPPDGLSAVRTIWMLSLTVLVLWSNRRLRFSDDDLRRMYGL